jgi:hypothetical protein
MIVAWAIRVDHGDAPSARRQSCRAVERGHQFAVGCAGGVEVVVFLTELATQFHDLLFEFGVASAEIVDVVGAAESGLTPCLFAEGLRESVAQLGVFSHEPVDAVVRAREIGDQGGATDRGAGDRRGGRLGGLGQDQGVQVGVPVEEGAINGCFSELRMTLRP